MTTDSIFTPFLPLTPIFPPAKGGLAGGVWRAVKSLTAKDLGTARQTRQAFCRPGSREARKGSCHLFFPEKVPATFSFHLFFL
jgi:hypothetical protein